MHEKIDKATVSILEFFTAIFSTAIQSRLILIILISIAFKSFYPKDFDMLKTTLSGLIPSSIYVFVQDMILPIQMPLLKFLLFFALTALLVMVGTTFLRIFFSSNIETPIFFNYLYFCTMNLIVIFYGLQYLLAEDTVDCINQFENTIDSLDQYLKYPIDFLFYSILSLLVFFLIAKVIFPITKSIFSIIARLLGF
ncbi:hypothetical protein HNQ80_005067 [Anaerosolibacter carboniphilus]|uniref:Uncharacterized protein n=1 Tax=Anaerosolibacter carboniphilus TaxID=1417629 RepID=A0A841L742_9FIRM|nr:hypothetical protein [Anaerosolibacter carboniphilus]